MKFNVDSRELAKAIRPSVEVATKNCKEGFRYQDVVTIKATKDKLEVFAYGGLACLRTTISNSATLNYKFKREGVVTVYATDILNGLTTMEPGDVEVKSVSGEVVITLLSDKSIKRTIELVDKVVNTPNVGTKFVQSIAVNKKIFAKGLKSVAFAPAVDPKMFTYMCVLMETLTEGKKQVLRFSAGTGGRFAVKEINGKEIFSADEEIKIIFPKNNLSSVYKIVSSITCDKVLVRTVEQDLRNNIPEQIMVELNAGGIEIVLSIFGIESFTKYPDLTSIINHKYSNRIYSDLKGWNYAVAGVDMTKRGHDFNIHNTKVVFESENERFMVTPQTEHANTIPISIVDVAGDANTIKGEKIWFKCNSDHLIEMVSHAGKTGEVQLNFDSQENLNDIPDDKPKQMMPVLIKFPEIEDKIQNTNENFYMFFTVSTK